jgi:glutamate--cysteine ligase
MVNMLNRELLQLVMDNHLHKEIWRGNFGLEKENNRVDGNGNLALTPHPKAFGNRMENPYIKTDFSESQLEMITPAFETIDETYQFLETLHDIVTLELHDEYLWPSSNPPALPNDEEIPIALMNDPEEDHYRLQLAEKYGRKRQLISGIHYNFSFNEEFLKRLYNALHVNKSFKNFKNSIYLKVARNVLKYRWLLIYLTGASPVFDKTYIEKCVQLSEHLDEKSYFFPNMNSLRNSVCGYRNEKIFYISYDSVEEYVRDLQSLVKSKELLSAREYYSPVRIKPAKGKDFDQALLQDGIAYLEVRIIDLNPLYKIGVSKESLEFVHVFLLFMLLIEDGPFGEEEQKVAALNHDSLIMNGLQARLLGEDSCETLEEKAVAFMKEMEQMLQVLKPGDETFIRLLNQKKQKLINPELSFAAVVKSEIQKSTYLSYHMNKAKQYAEESKVSGYQFVGYEDLELSTQLLLKAAVKRGISFEFLDREENFILLQKGDHREYVKQATKTSLDSYSTVLIMENKVVTKKILKQHGIRVPDGRIYHDLDVALADYGTYRNKPIVIKPKSTNFGLGISIFAGDFSLDDYQKAFEMAFEHDKTVLLEEFMTGKEYRFLVMGNEVVGILHRVPANVEGDGIHTIEQLIHEKNNKDPLRGKGYKTPLERIQLGEVEKMFLKNQSKHFTDIPIAGEVVYLRENSNISTGGDSIDFTDEIPESYKKIAIQSAKAAGATFCGVDMMIDDIETEATDSNYSIIEINFNPAIHIHCYPYKGENRKADEKILDLLFGKIQ